MPDPDRILLSSRTVTPEGVRDAAVVVREGRIAAIEPGPGAARRYPPEQLVELGDAWLLPGLVDTHVHVNQPGRTEWGGFRAVTRAAAAGGVTTLVDMPLNSIPATSSAAALRVKLAAASRTARRVDYGFWGGLVPGNAGSAGVLEKLAGAGALGFKCFLVPSGVDEFEPVTEAHLRAAMPVIARLGLPLLVHAELPGPIEAAIAAAPAGADPRRYATWLASRPPEAEVEAIRLVLRLCNQTGCAVHVVHLSAAEALPDLIRARGRGLPVTVETCPHYLTFDAESIPDGATAFKCAPPLRARANRERLWEALAAGHIDLVASDHSPCPPGLKRLESGDFMAAWGGIASLELGLAALWTEARARGFTPEHLARWMSERPARLAGLAERKGRIAVGAEADFVEWDADAEWTVEPSKLHQRSPVTPYAGRVLRGVVRRAYVRGQVVFDSGQFPEPSIGRWVTRAVDGPAPIG
jgi:allantoinase